MYLVDEEVYNHSHCVVCVCIVITKQCKCIFQNASFLPKTNHHTKHYTTPQIF